MGVIGVGSCVEEIIGAVKYGRSVSDEFFIVVIITFSVLTVGWVLCRRAKFVKRIAGALWMLLGAFLFVVFAYYGFKHGFSLDELWMPIYSVAVILVGWLMFRRGKE